MSTRDFLESSDYDQHEAFSFLEIGATISGVIVSVPRIVSTQFGNRLVLDVETKAGTYSVWVKPGAMAKAVSQAVKAVGRTEVEKGGKIAIKYIGDGEAKYKQSPPKQYQAKYEPPVGGVEEEEEPF